jgi:hypothetical protein
MCQQLLNIRACNARTFNYKHIRHVQMEVILFHKKQTNSTYHQYVFQQHLSHGVRYLTEDLMVYLSDDVRF